MEDYDEYDPTNNRTWLNQDEWKDTATRLQTTTPKQTWKQLFATVLTCEQRAQERRNETLSQYGTAAYLTQAVNQATTIPEPTLLF